MKASVVIPVWNGREYLPGCLDALLAQDYPDFEVIVVDNASVDGSAELIAEKYPQVRLIRNIHNLGFAGGCNAGLKVAQGDVLVLLNQDTVVLPGWLFALVKALQKPRVGIVGCKILYPDGRTIQHAGGWIEWPLGLAHHYGQGELDQGQWDQHREVEYVTGAAMAFSRRLIDQIGGLDEGFWPGYFEDADFCFRAREKGYKVLYIHEAVVLHKETTSIRDQFKLSCVYQKGRLRFILKHMPPERFLSEFVPAEKSYQRNFIRGFENSPLQIAYLEAMSSVPRIVSERWNADIQIMQAILFSLQELFVHSMYDRESKETDRRNVGVQTQRSSAEIPSLGSVFLGFPLLQEFQFRSSFPILGPFIAYFRRLFFDISAKWAIRDLIRQQEAINRLLIESVMLLYQQIFTINLYLQEVLKMEHKLIEIHDPEIDPNRIIQEIRERIRRRREELGYPRPIFPTRAGAAYPGEPEGEDYDVALYFHLRRANESYHQVGVEPLIVPSPRSSIPILGPLWDRIRREAHNLVLFYVNKLAQRQVTVNRHLVSTLNRMAVQIQEQQRRIGALEEELRKLREGS